MASKIIDIIHFDLIDDQLTITIQLMHYTRQYDIKCEKEEEIYMYQIESCTQSELGGGALSC